MASIGICTALCANVRPGVHDVNRTDKHQTKEMTRGWIGHGCIISSAQNADQTECRDPHDMDCPPTKMALITSECGATRSLGTKWP